MAHTLDTHQVNNGLNVNPSTFSYTCASDATVMVLSIVVAGGVARSGGAPTYNGVTMYQISTPQSASETQCEMWYLVLPDLPRGSAYTVSIPNSGTVTLHCHTTSAKAGSGKVSNWDTDNGNSGASANPSIGVTTSVNWAFIYSRLGDGTGSLGSGNKTQFPDSSWGTDHGSYISMRMYELQASAGSTTHTFTAGSDDWTLIIAAFKEVDAAVTLTVSEARSTHTADSVTVTQNSDLTVSEAFHAQTTDAVALTQDHILAVQEASHAQTTDPITLITSGDTSLTVQEARSTHAADAVDLTQQHLLVVQEATHGHLADNVVLATEGSLVVSDGAHAITNDAVSLTQQHTLTVDEARSTHTTDAVNLIQQHILVVAEARSTHTAESPTLDSSTILSVNEANHAIQADAISLTQVHILVVSECSHSHLGDTVTLVMPDTSIIVADARSLHAADSPVLTTAAGGLAPVITEVSVHGRVTTTIATARRVQIQIDAGMN